MFYIPLCFYLWIYGTLHKIYHISGVAKLEPFGSHGNGKTKWKPAGII